MSLIQSRHHCTLHVVINVFRLRICMQRIDCSQSDTYGTAIRNTSSLTIHQVWQDMIFLMISNILHQLTIQLIMFREISGTSSGWQLLTCCTDIYEYKEQLWYLSLLHRYYNSVSDS